MVGFQGMPGRDSCVLGVWRVRLIRCVVTPFTAVNKLRINKI